ncbi:sigma-70 family RNA polymerase sigma factor [Alicyclobacillus tolerans]|uniref:RNA polymerase sigma factor n=1 Tax=Alicyclobacillus tolerans TaxID=90970 RepID=UPI001F0034F6|nr:sigma-70 family RNA polymerase sigma factor [Alicyclobacillus tolerans]MCF8568563.1 sigma-70 family RNA polymerase sigma factor [Alicyclobacillus tolerans]
MQLEDLFHQYADDVFTFLVYLLKDRSLAEDVAQETFIKAMRIIEQGNRIDRPKAWLLQIARRTALDVLRKNKRRVTMAMEDVVQDVPDDRTGTEETAESNITVSELLSVFEEMKPEYRQVVLCRSVMDMTSKDTARTLGWTANHVRVILHRALKAARQELARRGWSSEIEK